MCISIEKPKDCLFAFNHDQYDKEVELMRKRISALLNKVDAIDQNKSYQNFKLLMDKGNHENLKR